MGDGYYKAAIFLASLGEDAASEIMKTLAPKELKKLGAKITELSNIPQKDLNEVYKEFVAGTSEVVGLSFEGKAYIQKVLTMALGNEQAERVIDNLVDEDEGGLETLKWMDPKAVASLIKGEHPQTVSLILSHLDTAHASDILPHLPEALRSDVMIRIATLEDIPPGVMQEIGAALQVELNQDDNKSITSKKVKGVRMVATILNQMDKTSEQAIMSSITEHQADLAEKIRALMFVFDDLVRLDSRSMQELMKEVNKEELIFALRATKEETKDQFFSNMSDRAATLLREDMEAKGPVKISEVEKAQQNILKTAKRLADAGTINLGGSSETLV